MSNKAICLVFALALSWAVLIAAPGARGQGKKTASGEEFFIISSINQATSQLVLKRPTEVTVLMKVDDRTKMLDEQGKALKLSDLRAGDTVWVISGGTAEIGATAFRIRKGPMTVELLHRLYLNYPTK